MAGVRGSDNVFLVTMPQFGVGGRPIELKREDRPLWPLSPLSREGGNFPRWSGPTMLVFGSANEIFVHDAATGDTSRHRVSISVPRASVKGTVAFRNARIVTVKNDEVIEAGDLVVIDGRIAAVGPGVGSRFPQALPASTPAARPSSRASWTCTPTTTAARPGCCPSTITRWRRSSPYGVTSTLDNSMWSQNIFPQSEFVEAGEIVGPRVFSTGDPLYAGDRSRHNALKTLDDARREAKGLQSYGAVSLKQYQQPERRQRSGCPKPRARSG